ASSERLAEVDGRNLQRLPVLRNSSPGDEDALITKQIRDPAVGQRCLGILGADQLLDQCADGSGRRGAAGVGGDMTAKEILELVSAARRQHVFLCRYAGDRRLVQAQDLGNLA